MPQTTPQSTDYTQAIEAWSRNLPWYRKLSARVGLQGKLVLVFMWLLMIALGASLWLYITETRRVFWHVMGEHAIEVSHTLGMASEGQLVRRDVPDLNRIAKKILKNPDIAAIGFYDASGMLLTAACTDPDTDLKNPSFIGGWKIDSRTLLQIQLGQTPALGKFAYATVPVIQVRQPSDKGVQSSNQNLNPSVVGSRGGSASRLVGYVTIAIRQADDEARLATVWLLLVAICTGVVLLSLPLVSMLVHRIFTPIRHLVDATHRLAGGDLSARVAIDRPDVIGMLARAFNEMAIRVKAQQDQLAAANQELGVANDQLAIANVQLAEANRDLEDKVRIRTVELEAANRRLSNEISEKEEFLRAVSHDLNAPLRNIAGMASMLLMKHRERFDEDIIHRLERIQKNVEVESDLISELLELSRIKTRRMKSERVDPESILRELADMFENDLKTRDIELHLDVQLPHIHGERARLRQVFQNLIDNAIKYMGNRPVREVHIGCHGREGEVEFYVRDTGPGIEADDLPKVFQVFRRGKSQAVQGVAGKGVGLASVKSIIETYNGTIWVESTVGEGTTFRFTINGKYLVDDSNPTTGSKLFAA